MLYRRSLRAYFRIVFACATVPAACVLWQGWDSSRREARAAESSLLDGSSNSIAPGEGGPDFNPAHVEGQALCVDCHRSEVATWNRQWQESGHGWTGYRYLTDPNATDYDEALGIAAEDLKTNSLCVKCHATPKLNDGHLAPVMGVSCEACHNPSGGEDGWLNVHAVYGPPGIGRLDEDMQHRQQRVAACTSAGQLRSADLYQLAARCYACHIVDNPQLVEAGHEAIGDQFSHLLEGFSNEKVRHNFHLDQGANQDVSSLWVNSRWRSGRTTDNRKRMIYVVGELARLETLVRNITTHLDLENESDFVYDMGEALEVEDNLQAALDGVQSPAVDGLRQALAGVVQAVADEEIADDAWLVDSLEVLVDVEFGDLEGDPRPAYKALADALRNLAIEIAASDGTELSGLDVEDL